VITGKDIPMQRTLEKVKAYLEALEQWEADWINANECWETPDGYPMLNEDLYDRWCNLPDSLQRQRNELKAEINALLSTTD
jgi:hypothetical protein